MKIIVERIEHSGLQEVVGFTENQTSFLHLTPEEFEAADKVGNEEDIREMVREYYMNRKEN